MSITSIITSIVEFSRRYALALIALVLVITAGLGWFVVNNAKINTDINQLLSADLPFRKGEAEMDKAFPQKTDTLLIIIDGDTPDVAEKAAATLTEKLQALPQQFPFIQRPDSIPFFRKNGLLLLSQDELSNVLEQIIQAQPMLGMLSSDPSLRGFFGTIKLMLLGLQQGQTDYSRLEQPLTQITKTLEAAMAGQDKPLDMQSLSSDQKPSLRDLRKFIITQPVLDYSELQPGAAASDTIRALAHDLNLTPEHGVHLRLTGPVALNDEEFASVANGTGLATAASGVLVFVILLLALRSLRIILPILFTLIVGLIATTAFAFATVGSLNLISVAFAVMFIGIAVDFGIQFGVRYRDQHHQEPDHIKAMTRTAAIVAIPLAMAAGSTALGFLAFTPTAYRGVSELGLIAGAGMLIAFFLNITLLPALLALSHPPAESESVGYRWAAPIDAFLLQHRRKILAAALALGLAGVGVTTQLRFDFDPLNLKDPHTESVSTLFDLMKDPDFSIYTIEALRPSLKEAQELADRLEKLPEVDHVMTLASFIPEDQDVKLALIKDTTSLLEPTLALSQMHAPSDQGNIDSARQVADTLRPIASQHPITMQLSKALDSLLAHPDHELLQRLHKNFIGAMQTKFDMMKQSLSPTHISLDTITDDLRRDWVTADGRYLVQAYPKGNARDRQTLVAFTNAVRQLVPDASGTPISIQESASTITGAFIHAGLYALAAIGLLSFFILRRVRDVILLLTPLILAGILTLGTIVLIGLPLNFANIIALPLLLSLGVSYAIYFVSYWRSGMANPLQSSMARAVLFSAATTLIAFGSLSLSSHPGTSGMGKLLTLALVYSLICTFFVLPVLLGRPKSDKQ